MPSAVNLLAERVRLIEDVGARRLVAARLLEHEF